MTNTTLHEILSAAIYFCIQEQGTILATTVNERMGKINMKRLSQSHINCIAECPADERVYRFDLTQYM